MYNIKRINRFALLFFACVVLSACSQTQPPQNTMRIHNSSGISDRPLNYASYDPSTAVPDADPEGRILALEALAQQDPRAAYDLGLRFFRGDGVRQDSYQAIKWMRDAAERGDLEAQKAIGRFYLTGLDEMGPDPQEAEKWLKIAVSRGDKESEKLLQEASEARKREIDYHRWRSYWHPRFYGYWHSGYPYRYHWRYGRWYY
ncbi:Sel1 repeat family protein [Candidatus Electrothrix laxa]